jgi:phosphatidate cytidylyltransferase
VNPALASRLAIAIPGIAIAIAVVAIGGAPFAIVVAVVGVLGLYELYSLTAAQRPLRWAGYLGAILVILLAWGYDPGERGVVLGLGLSLLLVAVAGLILPRRDDITARMATTLLGVAYLGLPLAALVLTRELPDGAGAVVNVLVGVWVFDTASYVGGRLWGRTPIAPRTSPRKTVEGAVIGLAAGTLAVWIAGLYMDWITGWESLILGLAICPAAYLGDLFESMLKRDAGAKDSGRLLLAHGGVLDRFDALLFGAVAAYFVTVWLVY